MTIRVLFTAAGSAAVHPEDEIFVAELRAGLSAAAIRLASVNFDDEIVSPLTLVPDNEPGA